jgi:hypothetical protein
LESPSSTSAVLRRRFAALGSVIGVTSTISSVEGATIIRFRDEMEVLGWAEFEFKDDCLSFFIGRILTLVQTRCSGPLDISKAEGEGTTVLRMH